MSADFQNENHQNSKSSRTATNRANAQHSTGPRTAEGKAASSRNAMVTGLTGRAVLLASDDMDEYILHLSRHHAEYLPLTDAESELVQTIADCEWRLRRIPALENGIYALGERQFATEFLDESPSVRSALIQAQTYLVYQRQLNNLSIQESRLLRQKSKAIAALELLKKDRPPSLAATVPRAASTSAAASNGLAGFEFSSASAASDSPAVGLFSQQTATSSQRSNV